MLDCCWRASPNGGNYHYDLSVNRKSNLGFPNKSGIGREEPIRFLTMDCGFCATSATMSCRRGCPRTNLPGTISCWNPGGDLLAVESALWMIRLALILLFFARSSRGGFVTGLGDLDVQEHTLICVGFLPQLLIIFVHFLEYCCFWLVLILMNFRWVII